MGVILSGIFIFLIITRPRISLEGKVESFLVCFESGENVTVLPSSFEGSKLSKACEDFINNLMGQWMWAVNDEEIARATNSSLHLIVELKDSYNFTFFVDYSNVNKVETANRILFFLSGSFPNTVLFAQSDAEYPWGGSYGSKKFQQLVDVVSELPRS
jgi:hypothetical protein